MIQALLAFLLAFAQPAEPPATPAPGAPIVYGYRVVATYPHDPQAFTQGLVYRDGEFLESTGLVGRSTIRRVRIADGHVLQSVPIPPGNFGEGIVDWGDQIVSITWQGGIGFRWNRRTLRQTGEWHYPGEGWGLTRNNTDIIMSDGTADLRFLDPRTLAERRRITVTVRGRPVTELNELEWIRGEIWANIWHTGFIARIDPATGNVTGIVDLRPLAAENASDEDGVLNGIAYDPAGDRVFVTGKLWPHVYEIDLDPRPGSAVE